MKRPSFQFYPGDWLNDAALRMCSVGARGLWIDMLAFMHQGSDYGYLKVNHKPILPINLARMVGATLSDCEGWLAELEEAGCFSRDAQGSIYSRRMIRDEEIREKRAAGGHLGGNPALKGKAKKPVSAEKTGTSKVNHPPNLDTTPSSSSSSSSSSNTSASASRPARKAVDKSKPDSEKHNSLVWEAYATAYAERYGSEPPTSAKNFAHCRQIVERVGIKEAPGLSAWYVKNENMPYYVSRGHPLDSLVKDCDGMLVRMRRGQGMTRKEAGQADEDSSRSIGFKRAAGIANAIAGDDSPPQLTHEKALEIAHKETVF